MAPSPLMGEGQGGGDRMSLARVHWTDSPLEARGFRQPEGLFLLLLFDQIQERLTGRTLLTTMPGMRSFLSLLSVYPSNRGRFPMSPVVQMVIENFLTYSHAVCPIMDRQVAATFMR